MTSIGKMFLHVLSSLAFVMTALAIPTASDLQTRQSVADCLRCDDYYRKCEEVCPINVLSSTMHTLVATNTTSYEPGTSHLGPY